MKEDAAANNNIGGYHRAVKTLTSKEAPKRFDIRTMLPGKTDEEIGNLLAEYFNGTSDEFVQILGPRQCVNRCNPPEKYQIAAKLKKMKKPKGQVDGDIPRNLQLNTPISLPSRCPISLRGCMPQTSGLTCGKKKWLQSFQKTVPPQN